MKITPRRVFALLMAPVLLLSLCACAQKLQTEHDEPKMNTAGKNSRKVTGRSCIAERRERFCILVMTDTAPLRTAESQKVQRQLDKKRSKYEQLQMHKRIAAAEPDGISDTEGRV